MEPKEAPVSGMDKRKSAMFNTSDLPCAADASSKPASASKTTKVHRKSMVNPAELKRLFYLRQGVTEEEIEEAFKFLSSDGKRITTSDVKMFVDKWLPASGQTLQIPDKLFDSKVTLSKVLATLIDPLNSEVSFNDAFGAVSEMVDDKQVLSRAAVRAISNAASLHGTGHRTDYSSVLHMFDLDRDGKINIEDFKRIYP